ncbi:arginine N-succinyltransferase [Marinobacter sp. X15-166B]|uniref:arginine N-succinyltransferase n=1 Tax=Marinobacter sp. X15-166B TaxID=1897620 RepID=UPI00085C78C3|nr:arginine N-succinyltransferase [Marinobacter sp. X15-166B]OEY65592.1 arginine N-succinyltransferase [Marinobacter sp. X15-166B]
MWLVRPATHDDLDGILGLLQLAQANPVSSTLPATAEGVSEKIAQSVQALSGAVNPDAGQRLLFVLQASDTGAIRGVAGIDGRAGNGQPFYNYRQDSLIHASHALGISRRVQVLYPSHSLTGLTLLCAFLIDPDLVGTDAFELLSRARLLFIASHRSWFTDETVVELAGVKHDSGAVPFWDSLGRHFFNMDFDTADGHSGALSKTFIAELMPPNPIYVTLLTEDAQQALGVPHDRARPSFELLQREGFQCGEYIDVFDGGPVLEARTNALKSVITSHRKALRASEREDGDLCLLATGTGAAFRCTLAKVVDTLDDAIQAPLAALNVLGCQSGADAWVTPL